MWARKLAGWLCLIPAASALAVAFRSPAWLASHVLPDDAYYYFQIARNAAAGHGVSLDGIHLTNGFHPLWMAILVGLGKLLPSAAVIPVALLIGGACGAVALLLVRKLLVRWGVSGGWLLTCVGLLSLNPWLEMQWVNGLETAVACVLIVATWLYADSIVRSGALFVRQAVVVSALASIASLGRTDFAVALLPLLVYLWCKIWQSSQKKLQAALGYGLLMLATGLAIQLPWLAWNWHVFGTLVQSSGASFSFVHHQLLYNVHANDLVTNIKGAVLGVWNAGKLVLYAFASPLLYAVVLASVALARRRSKLSFRLQSWGVGAWAGVGLLLLFGVHGAVRWAFRSWYAAPLVIAVAKLRDGGRQFDVMTKAEVDAIRKRSLSGGNGPWVTDYEEMAKKTVIRRLFKMLPVSVEMQRAVSLDEQAEHDSGQQFGDFIDTSAVEEDKPAPRTTGDLLEGASA
jgi:hypothetical protein